MDAPNLPMEVVWSRPAQEWEAPFRDPQEWSYITRLEVPGGWLYTWHPVVYNKTPVVVFVPLTWWGRLKRLFKC